MPTQKKTLAAGVMAVFSASAGFAQSQDPPHYCYSAADCKAMRNAPRVPQAKPPAERPPQTLAIPTVLHFCAAHCLTFTMQKDGKLHNYTNLPGQKNEDRAFAIEKFTPEEVVIHRKDTGSYPGEVTMRGRMDYAHTSAYGDHWQIAWGDALDSLPENDLARAQRQGIPMNPQMEASPLALLLSLMVRGGGSGGSDSGGGDLPARISSLQDQLDRAKDDCFRSTVRSGSPATSSACDRKTGLEYDLSEARGELRDEIDNLTEAHNKLAQDCNAGDNAACEKQKQVDAQLSRDRQGQVGSIFR